MVVRLKGEALAALRIDCFHRDRFRCVECGRKVFDDVPNEAPHKAHMAHVKGRGAGGSDTIENVTTKCGACHLVEEHNPKSVKAKS